jgi:hypothetical protein
MDEFDGLGRRKKKYNHAKPVSTFDELKLAVASVKDRLEGLCDINPAWESKEKLENKVQGGTGLRKDKDGNWRDLEGGVVESADNVNFKDRQETQETIDGIFKSLGTTEADIKRTLLRFENDLGIYAEETSELIDELYPVLKMDDESRYRQRERYEQTGDSTVASSERLMVEVRRVNGEVIVKEQRRPNSLRPQLPPFRAART